MADYIDKQIQIFSKIEKLFDKDRDELKDIEKKLNKEITEIIDQFSHDYGLKSESETSVNSINYYSIKSRVKSTHSLKEKLIRKDLGLKISNTLLLDPHTFHKNYANVKESLFKIDDIIGVRVVTELKADCTKVHKLIHDYNDHFIGRKIIFNTQELKNQPEKMQNGFPIYRIKGTYKNDYGFELQIKSKIDEAWGEMDHSIFYKDYSVSPIKNTVQVTMNNVGELLDKIEELLLGLRNSEKNYKEKKEEIDFLKELNEDVFEAVKNKLGDNYELGKIASLLKFIREKTKVKRTTRKLDKIETNFLDYKVKSILFQNYVEHRKNSFELLVAEALYINWFQKANPSLKITAKNYSTILKDFIAILSEHLVLKSKELENKNHSLDKNFVSVVFASLSDYSKSKSIFIQLDLMIELKITEQYLIEALESYFDQNLTINKINSIVQLIIVYYSKTHLGYKTIGEAETIIEILEEVNSGKKFQEIVYDINDDIQTKLDRIKLSDNMENYDKVKFLIKLNETVISNVK